MVKKLLLSIVYNFMLNKFYLNMIAKKKTYFNLCLVNCQIVNVRRPTHCLMKPEIEVKIIIGINLKCLDGK